MIAGGLTALTIGLLALTPAAPAAANSPPAKARAAKGKGKAKPDASAAGKPARPEITTVPAPKVTCEATELILGDEAARIGCSVQIPDGQSVGAASNVGTLTRIGGLEGGVQRFEYRPPSEKVPRVALLAFWRTDGAADHAPEAALMRVSLLGRQTLTVATRPGAQVEVALGRRRFGPVKASSAGSAQVDVEVPPEATGAVVFARSAGQVIEDKLPIEVPGTNPLHAVLVPGTLTHGSTAWLWVFHQDRLPGRELEFAHRGLVFERLRFARDRGLFRVTVKPEAREARLEVRLNGSPEASIVMESLLP